MKPDITLTEIHDEFRKDLLGARIAPPDFLIDDGKIHRCDVMDKPRGNLAASYLLHTDQYPAGGYQNFYAGTGWIKWKFPTERLHKTTSGKQVFNKPKKGQTP